MEIKKIIQAEIINYINIVWPHKPGTKEIENHFLAVNSQIGLNLDRMSLLSRVDGSLNGLKITGKIKSAGVISNSNNPYIPATIGYQHIWKI